MTIEVTNTVEDRLKILTHRFGSNEQEIIEKAITLYFNHIQEKTDFEDEFNIWDDLSDEALNNFEAQLEER
jgi:hypothetical protein